MHSQTSISKNLNQWVKNNENGNGYYKQEKPKSTFWSLLQIAAITILMLLGFLLGTLAHAVSGEKKILLVDATLAVTTTGSTVCLPRMSDDFVFYLKAVNLAGSSPTLDVKIQHSDDESTWIDLDTFTQATTGTSTQLKMQNSASVHVLRCIRAVATLGGTASPSYNTTIHALYRIKN